MNNLGSLPKHYRVAHANMGVVGSAGSDRRLICQHNTPTESVGGNIATLAEPEKHLNKPLYLESIESVATESVASS